MAHANSSRVNTTGTLHGGLVLLGRMAQVPRRLGGLDTAVLDQATVIVVIEGLPGFFD
jgi:hypothetical protein